jgi:hypothetical protein
MGEGLITMTFSDYLDLEHYKNNWDYFYSNFGGNPANPLDVDYYRHFVLAIPLATGTQQCGDLTGYQEYNIHPSAIVTTGGTGPWTMSITMPTITNSLTWTSCDTSCSDYTNDIVNIINGSSTSLLNNISITNNTGSRLQNPIYGYRALLEINNTVTATTITRSIVIPKYVNETIPYSGSPLTIIPSLSAQTCDLSGYSLDGTGSTLNIAIYRRNIYWYQFRIISNTGDFEIWTYNINTNPIPTPPYFKIYENIGGVPNVIDPTYFI